MPTPVGEHIERLVEQAQDSDELDQALYIDLRSYLVDVLLDREPLSDAALSGTAGRADVLYVSPSWAHIRGHLPLALVRRRGSTRT